MNKPYWMSLVVRGGAIAWAGVWCFLMLSTATGDAAGRSYDGFMRIGGGRLNAAEWTSTLTKWHKERTGPQGVCVSTVLATKDDGVDIREAFECDVVRDDGPFMQFVSGRSENGPRSVVSVIFTQAARRVVIDLGKGDGSTIKLRRLSKSKASQLGIAQVGYWTHAFAGPVCIQRITVYDGHGSMLSDGKLGC
ncbi:MAG TPA: hypothetical protein VFM94_01550 [Solirubrobacterales bacterium]|nr:hypothetical protein [Solirubrobacterales bacterium]